MVGVVGLTYLGTTGTPAGTVKVPATEGMTDQQLAGLATYNDEGCTSCHQIHGIGGHTGPDLSRAGFRWDEAAIRAQIVTPKDDRMPTYDHLSQEQLDSVVAYLMSLK